MAIETLADIVEDLADKFGIYGHHEERLTAAEAWKCRCRVCFVSAMTARILAAVEVEQALEAHGLKRKLDPN